MSFSLWLSMFSSSCPHRCTYVQNSVQSFSVFLRRVKISLLNNVWRVLGILEITFSYALGSWNYRIGSPLVLPQHFLLQTCMTASSRLFPALGGSVITHFLCGIFNKVPISVTKKETKDCPMVNNAPGAEISVYLQSCAIPVAAGHAASISGLWGFVYLRPRVEKITCAIAQLWLHCSS